VKRPEPRRRLASYVRAVIAGGTNGVERRNGWQLAEAAGEATPYGMQRLIAQATWDAEAVRDDLTAYMREHLGTPAGIGILDETGFLKKWDKAAGVQRQYSGTTGRIENCQIGVFLVYRGRHGTTALVDRALYLPEAWCSDRVRCRTAGIPDEVGFATKPQLAQRMLARALDAGLPMAWVTGDTVYGQDRRLRLWLEARGQPFVLAVPANERPLLWRAADHGQRHVRADATAAALPASSWRVLSGWCWCWQQGRAVVPLGAHVPVSSRSSGGRAHTTHAHTTGT
jgi:SRSO17 transposase